MDLVLAHVDPQPGLANPLEAGEDAFPSNLVLEEDDQLRKYIFPTDAKILNIARLLEDFADL